MGLLCDRGPLGAGLGAGEAWTNSPTVWGQLMPALWLVRGPQKCPSISWGECPLDRQGGLRRDLADMAPGMHHGSRMLAVSRLMAGEGGAWGAI